MTRRQRKKRNQRAQARHQLQLERDKTAKVRRLIEEGVEPPKPHWLTQHQTNVSLAMQSLVTRQLVAAQVLGISPRGKKLMAVDVPAPTPGGVIRFRRYTP